MKSWPALHSPDERGVSKATELMLSFADLAGENTIESGHIVSEKLVLFLERIYTSGINDDEAAGGHGDGRRVWQRRRLRSWGQSLFWQGGMSTVMHGSVCQQPVLCVYL